MSRWPAQFIDHANQSKPLPCVSHELSDLSLAEAYEIQDSYVDLLGSEVVGYKAALTALPAQQFFGLSSPISGVLLKSGAYNSGASAQAVAGVKLETELGFVVGRTITEPVSEDTVLSYIEACLPMLEIARPYLAGKPQGVDLIASNAASYAFVKGTAQPIDEAMLDTHHVALKRDSVLLHEATSGELMEGQRSALCWLINQRLSLGSPVSAGHLLMTGSLGALQDGTPGNYQADFGSLGAVTLTLASCQV